jgi:hypothetical protein
LRNESSLIASDDPVERLVDVIREEIEKLIKELKIDDDDVRKQYDRYYSHGPLFVANAFYLSHKYHGPSRRRLRDKFIKRLVEVGKPNESNGFDNDIGSIANHIIDGLGPNKLYEQVLSKDKEFLERLMEHIGDNSVCLVDKRPYQDD